MEVHAELGQAHYDSLIIMYYIFGFIKQFLDNKGETFALNNKCLLLLHLVKTIIWKCEFIFVLMPFM